jgi:deoxyribose-phosphate aldolase
MTASAHCAASARRLISLIDLTSLNDDDDAGRIRRLAAMADSRGTRVAALCVWPRFITVAIEALGGHAIPVAAVTNFPRGSGTADEAAAEAAAAIALGAREIDVVFPYRAFLAGDAETGLDLVRRCRVACGDRARLKVILETGQLEPAQVRAAGHLAAAGGADFLKTSTGKTQPGATPAAVAALLEIIAEARAAGRALGLKVSGGIRTHDQAQAYLDQYEQAFGVGSAAPENFRIGASSLLGDLRDRLV